MDSPADENTENVATPTVSTLFGFSWGETAETKHTESKVHLDQLYETPCTTANCFTFSKDFTMEVPVFTLDSFTNLPFKGNPAAVCPLMHVSKILKVICTYSRGHEGSHA